MMQSDSSGLFIGRNDDLRAVEAILLSPTCRLLTILGMGGIGKTQLAKQIAHRVVEHFDDAIDFVDLQHLDASASVITALLDQFQLKTVFPDDGLQEIIAFLSNKQLLIVLDNFELLLDDAPVLSEILVSAPQIKILTTSRVALRLQDEHIYTLMGLATPQIGASDSDIAQTSAVQLFLSKARQVRHDFRADLPVIADICRLVDGSPLAIELAAVWAKVLDSDEILREIEDCIDFLETDMRDMPVRHQSIRAVFDGSWKQLNKAQQTVLKHLAVFREGFNRQSAKAIANASLPMLLALADKSLIYVQDDGRYAMHSMIRQLTLTHFEDDQENYRATSKTHSTYFADKAYQLGEKLRCNEQLEALRELHNDIQNLRTGWEWAVTHAESHLIEQYLFGLVLYHEMRNRGQAGIDLLIFSDEFMSQLPVDTQAKIELLRGWLLIILWQNIEGVETIWHAIKKLETPPIWYGMTLIPAINHPELLGERYQTIVNSVRNELQIVDDGWQRAWLLKAIGEYHFVAREYDQAAQALDESATLFQTVGDDWATTWSYGNLGRVLVSMRRYDEADAIYQKSFAICQRIGDMSGWIDVMNKRAELALDQHDFDKAERIILQGFQLAFEHRTPIGTLTYLLYTLAKLRIEQRLYMDAITFICVLLHDPIVARGWRDPEIDMLNQRIGMLEKDLTSQEFTVALERGKEADLVETVRSILADVELIGDDSEAEISPLIEPLTERETQVLRLIAVGLSNRQIADELSLAVGTIKTHAHNIYGKLGVDNRTEATVRAHHLNLV